MTFSLLKTTGQKPPPRGGVAAAQLGDRVFTLGGWDSERLSIDLHVLDMKSLIWTKIGDSGEGLMPHTLSPLSPTQLLLIGGFNSKRVRIYDVEDSSWSEESPLPAAMCGENEYLSGHSAVELKAENRIASILVLGGFINSDNYEISKQILQ